MKGPRDASLAEVSGTNASPRTSLEGSANNQNQNMSPSIWRPTEGRRRVFGHCERFHVVAFKKKKKKALIPREGVTTKEGEESRDADGTDSFPSGQ